MSAPISPAPLRLQLASDLHLEHLQIQFPGERVVACAPDADLLVLAGDIDNGVQAIETFGDWPVPVLYIPGNHEFYEQQWEETRHELRRVARRSSVMLLDNDRADFSMFANMPRFVRWYEARRERLSSVRILGATMWTDYGYSCGHSQRELMDNAEQRIVDHRLIRTTRGLFRSDDALSDHRRSRDWLSRELGTPFEGRTVVVTHHGPHPNSVHPRFRRPDTELTNASFVSDLSALMPQVDLWMHGHVHDSFDYCIDQCRVVTNPRGYALNRKRTQSFDALEFENPVFESAYVVAV